MIWSTVYNMNISENLREPHEGKIRAEENILFHILSFALETQAPHSGLPAL